MKANCEIFWVSLNSRVHDIKSWYLKLFRNVEIVVDASVRICQKCTEDCIWFYFEASWILTHYGENPCVHGCSHKHEAWSFNKIIYLLKVEGEQLFSIHYWASERVAFRRKETCKSVIVCRISSKAILRYSSMLSTWTDLNIQLRTEVHLPCLLDFLNLFFYCHILRYLQQRLLTLTWNQNEKIVWINFQNFVWIFY